MKNYDFKMQRYSVVLILFLASGLSQLTWAAFQSSSIQTNVISSSSSSVIRLRANKLRRPESCRENLPRRSEDLPVLVITGRVKEVYMAAENQTSATNKALVTIGRVIKGNQQLIGTDILVSGFNSTSSTPCPNYVKHNDTFIWLLNHDADRRYSIQGNNMLSMNLANLDKINAIASDEPYKRRPPIEDILCEAHYCAYGRCVANERGQVSCQCPDICPLLPTPVCGSDNNTYTNECHLIKEGCRQQRPLFVTRESSC